jgi:hypothetical protein
MNDDRAAGEPTLSPLLFISDDMNAKNLKLNNQKVAKLVWRNELNQKG